MQPFEQKYNVSVNLGRAIAQHVRKVERQLELGNDALPH